MQPSVNEQLAYVDQRSFFKPQCAATPLKIIQHDGTFSQHSGLFLVYWAGVVICHWVRGFKQGFRTCV